MIAADVFCRRFATEFAPDVTVTLDDGLFETLGLDSLDAFRLLMWLELLGQVDVPDEKIPQIFTVRDAYDYYCSLAVRRG